MSPTNWVLFAVVSGLFVVVSVLRPSRHGIYRLLAWESCLGLVLVNVDSWFRNPASPLQICSWLLLATSVYLVVESIRLLRKIGKPTDELEATTALVVVGAYRYIRHPLYSSLLFLAWGAFLKEPSLLGLTLAVAASVFLVATAKVEEILNVQKFGNGYQGYMQRSKMFIPFVF